MNASTMAGAYWSNGVALVLTVAQEGSTLIEIDRDCYTLTAVFAANGEYIVGSGQGNGVVGVWRVEDGKQMATLMTAGNIRCLGVSKDDGRWIVAGTDSGEVIVWDAKTFEQVFSHKEDKYCRFSGVDFSPDSTRHRVVQLHCHHLGRRNWQENTNTPPRLGTGDSSEILASRQPNRDSY